MERLDTVGYRGQVGRFRPEQIAQITSWDQMYNPEQTVATMHVLKQQEKDGSTETTLNPLESALDEYWVNPDCGCEHTIAAGRRF